jgi:hypothetical protein
VLKSVKRISHGSTINWPTSKNKRKLTKSLIQLDMVQFNAGRLMDTTSWRINKLKK